MKKHFMASLCFILLMNAASACDICGGGVSTLNPYLFPHLSKPYFGLTYFRHHYHTHTDDGSINKETYNALLLTAQYSVGKRIQLTALLPYQFNRLATSAQTRNLHGVGDITLLGNYKVWQQMTSTVRHTITVGVGIKLPTGKYAPVSKSEEEEQNFQLGTGSVDYLVSAAYRVALQEWAFAATTSYKYNTENGDGYRYGDVMTSGVTAVYRTGGEKLSVLPYVSLSEEHYMRDADRHILQNHSGGDVLLAGVGLDVNTRKVTIGVNYQLPLSQTMARGEIEAKSRFSARFSFLL